MIEDSDRRCAHCGKRMMVDIGQRDMVGDGTVGEVELVHECWSCGYVERDRAWKRPRIVVGGPTLAERLHKQRTEGWVIPMRIDNSPFPEGEFDDAE
jgi:hypothetical protein